MRRTHPLILGGGPAGATAAILLARSGAQPLVLEKSRVTGDALCGGFMSWRTIQSLERTGVSSALLGGHPVRQLRLFAGKQVAEADLPHGAIGVSRHRLDTLLLKTASGAGAGVERGVTVRSVSAGGTVSLADGSALEADSIFIATGKHDLRGIARPRTEDDPAMGLRIRLPPHPRLERMIGDAIELFLFDGGYAGLVLQEDDSANICIAVRKSRLTAAGGRPADLIRSLGIENPRFGDRIETMTADMAVDAIAAVPYGWRARNTGPGLFLLGDQAAVIPSLAGEGNGIALASGRAAAVAWQTGGRDAAPAYQRSFAVSARMPIAIATRLWHWGERPGLAWAATRILHTAPGLAALLARTTRITAA